MHRSVEMQPRSDNLDMLGLGPRPSFSYSDDDPGMMSEADTSATGFRRNGKARSSLPVSSMRNSYKIWGAPLGVVFLQFRDETKRSVLPNEVTTLDTVKALFVRAFPKLLSMQYLDASDKRKIYVLDQRKDMFYELEDLRDVRDRSVLKILETDCVDQTGSTSLYGPHFRQPADEASYYSEPEFDTYPESFRYPSLHSRPAPGRQPIKGAMSSLYPSSSPNDAYLPPPNIPPKPQRQNYQIPMGYGDEPIYANMQSSSSSDIMKRPPSRSGTATPIVDEEARYRVDAMERHLAALTGMVQHALTGVSPQHPVQHLPGNGMHGYKNSDYANVYVSPRRSIPQKDQKSMSSSCGEDSLLTNGILNVNANGPVKLTKHANLNTTDINSSNTNHPQHTLENGFVYLRYPDPMLMEYLENLQSRIRDMRGEARSLRRQHQTQALSMREIIKDTYERLRNELNLLLPGSQTSDRRSTSTSRAITANQVQFFQQDAVKLARDLYQLESGIEGLRGLAVDGSPLSLREVEKCTNELNNISGNVSDLRLKFPELQEKLKTVMTSDMELVLRDEMFIKEQPEKLEDMAKRCRKLTSTLLSLNKLASVQDDAARKQTEVLVDLPPEQTIISPTSLPETLPVPPARRESLTASESFPPAQRNGVVKHQETLAVPVGTQKDSSSSESSSPKKQLDKKAQDMLDDLLSELEVFTDVSSREPTPDRDSTIKRSPKTNAKRSANELSAPYQQLTDSLSPSSITPSNSSQSTNTTMSSHTETSSNFSGSDSGTTISKVQVGVGDRKTTISPVPMSIRSGLSSGVSTPARKGSEPEKNLAAWLSNVNLPAPPPRSTSKSPMMSPLPKPANSSQFYTLPSNYMRSTVSEPGDHITTSFTEYSMTSRELRSPSIKDQRLTPQQQDRIASYYTSKLRKNSYPGNTLGSPIDDIANDILAYEANKIQAGYARSEPGGTKRTPPALPPRPGQEDPSVAPPLPPRNRQEVLEERHQELLRKQKQLQEQYARLQQLQRDQKMRASSPVNKTSVNPQRGSLDDIKRQHLIKSSNATDLYAVPSSRPFFHQPQPQSNGNGNASGNGSVTNTTIICETDIL